jgi:hypothetical protein
VLGSSAAVHHTAGVIFLVLSAGGRLLFRVPGSRVPVVLRSSVRLALLGFQRGAHDAILRSFWSSLGCSTFEAIDLFDSSFR